MMCVLEWTKGEVEPHALIVTPQRDLGRSQEKRFIMDVRLPLEIAPF